MKNLALILLMPFFVSACGLGLLDVKSDNERSNYNNQDDFQTAFRESDVSCSSTDCPDSIVGMYFTNKSGGTESIGSCSGTYIGNNRVLTNAHCIPDDLKYSNANCSGRMMINFPANSRFGKEKYECARILKSARDTSTSFEPDWAVLQFSGTTNRTPARMDFNGIEPFSYIDIYKVNFNLSASVRTTGNVVKTRCQVNNDHFQSTSNLGRFSALFDANSCDNTLIKGNSGSGVFNARGEVVGVFSFSMLIEEKPEKYRSLRAKYPGIRQNIGGGTNLACVDYLNPNVIPRICEYRNSSTYGKRALTYQSVFLLENDYSRNTDIQNEVGERVQANSDYVEYTADMSSLFAGFDMSLLGGRTGSSFELYKYVMQARFPQFPSCVKPNAPEEFEIEVSYLVGRNLTVNKTTFRDELDLNTLPAVFEVKRGIDSRYWATDRDGSFLNSTDRNDIGSVGKGAKVLLPICN